MPSPQYRIPGVLGSDATGLSGRTGGAMLASVEAKAETEDKSGESDALGVPAFSGVSRADVYREVEDRVLDASLIRQGDASLCGPAVVTYILARNRPGEYERYVKKLFETGDASVGELRVRPGEDCRRHSPSGIGAADWVALAGLRDSENIIFDYDEVSDKVAGITFPGSIASWLERMGFAGVRNDTNLVFHKSKSNFLDAVDQFRKGRAVCLFVSIDGIQKPPPGRGFFEKIAGKFPNHWVVLTDVDSTKDDDVHFKIFTWGFGDYDIPGDAGFGKLKMSSWLDNYYGFVSCDV
jgi:hypothetical protein